MAYLVDSDVLIEAKNRHYGFDFCPGFWEWLVREQAVGNVCSVERIYQELTAGADQLAAWAQAQGAEFFLAPDAATTASLAAVAAVANAMRVNGQPYAPAAMASFLASGDYCLIAHALAHGERLCMRLAEIKRARSNGDYDTALAGCAELLRRDAEDLDALRLRASIHSLKKGYAEALRDHREIIASGSSKINDYYLAADAAFMVGECKQGCEWLVQVLAIGTETGDDAFESAAHFLLAYGRMQLGQYEQALESLSQAEAKDANIALPLPGESGVAAARHLRKEIDRRKAVEKKR